MSASSSPLRDARPVSVLSAHTIVALGGRTVTLEATSHSRHGYGARLTVASGDGRFHENAVLDSGALNELAGAVADARALASGATVPRPPRDPDSTVRGAPPATWWAAEGRRRAMAAVEGTR
jgi:mRNA-degrading endonuclease toxin of MazEF toxin-antitoxin module